MLYLGSIITFLSTTILLYLFIYFKYVRKGKIANREVITKTSAMSLCIMFIIIGAILLLESLNNSENLIYVTIGTLLISFFLAFFIPLASELDTKSDYNALMAKLSEIERKIDVKEPTADLPITIGIETPTKISKVPLEGTQDLKKKSDLTLLSMLLFPTFLVLFFGLWWTESLNKKKEVD